MAYTPPSGASADFNLKGVYYTSPGGYSADFLLSDGTPVVSVYSSSSISFASAATKASNFAASSSTSISFLNASRDFSFVGYSSAAFVSYNPHVLVVAGTAASFVSGSKNAVAFTSASNTIVTPIAPYTAASQGRSTTSFFGNQLFSSSFYQRAKTIAVFAGRYEATARLLGVCKSTVSLASNSRHSAPVAVLGSSRLNFIGRGIRPCAVSAVSATHLMLFGTSVIKASYSTPLTTNITAFGQAGRLTILRIAGGSAGSFGSSYTIQPVGEVQPDADTITAFSRQKVIYVVG